MVRSKSTSRFSSINNLVILAQTDTTVGFASQNYKQLATIKSRPPTKPFIKIYSSNKQYLDDNNRVPQNRKNFIRRSKKTTFIIKRKAFRINKEPKDSQILRDLSPYYSTSANEINKKFNREFCELKTDIIIEDKNGLDENNSSSLLKLNSVKRVKIR